MNNNTWKLSFKALWLAEFIAIMGFSTSSPIIPMYLKTLGLVDAAKLNIWTGIVQAGPAIGLAIFAPIWGSLADNYGRKLMLLRAMIGGAILIGLMSIVTSPWQLAVLKTIQGCVTGTVAAATVLTASIVPQAELGYRLGLLQMAVYLGNSVGPLFGGLVADTIGVKANFIATSILLSCAAVVVYKFVYESFIPKPRTKSILRNAIPDYKVLFSSPALASLMAVVFAVQFAAAVVAPMLPIVIMSMTGDTPGVASMSGLIVAAGSVSGAIAAAAIGKISGKFGYARTLLICMTGATIFYIPQGFATSPWQLLILRLGSGIFLGGTMPSVNALIASICVKDKQGATYGLSSSISNTGAALGPAAGATLATLAGYSWVFFATSAILGSIAVSVFMTVRHRKTHAIEQT